MLCRVMEPSAMESWSLTLLGGFELRLADGAVVDLPGQKDRALLTLLAMGGGDVRRTSWRTRDSSRLRTWLLKYSHREK